jgi:reactive intermediate/imine deaminase
MTERRAGRASDAPPPAGPYSHAVRSGSLVVTSGQIGVDPKTGALVGLDVASQARQAWSNTVAALSSVSAEPADVVQVRVFLVELGDFEPMNAVFAELLPTPFPARTTVYVTMPPSVRIEIDALAVLREP